MTKTAPVPRPSHKQGHPNCPFTSWSACDKAVQVRFGQCVAVVGDREPTPCTRWAVSEQGLCGQHYASVIERARKAEREAARMADINARVDAYIAWVKDHPSVHDNPPKEGASVKGKPFRLTELA